MDTTLENVLTSFFIEEQRGALEARIFDYEKGRYGVYDDTKISTMKLRLHLELIQRNLVDFFTQKYPEISHRKQSTVQFEVNRDTKEGLRGIFESMKYFMVPEDIARYADEHAKNSLLYIEFMNSGKQGVLIKRIGIIDEEAPSGPSSQYGNRKLT